MNLSVFYRYKFLVTAHIFVIRMIRIVFVLLVVFVNVSIGALQWRQLAASDLPHGPVGRTSPSNVLYHDSIIMYGGAVSSSLLISLEFRIEQFLFY